MPSSLDLLEQGRLREALAAQTEVVKSKPTDVDARFVLFTLLCFEGNLDRAQIHLEALVNAEASARGGASIYHALLTSEQERRFVFEKQGHPSVPPGEFAGMEDRLLALEALRSGDREAAARSMERANEAASERAGVLDDMHFTSLCDYDDLLGEVIEVYAGARYIWMPLERVSKITVEEPKRLLDTLWLPAQLEQIDGETANVHLPGLYPGTYACEDDALQLGRATQWVEVAGDAHRGIGLKLLFGVFGGEARERPLIETRSLRFEPAAAGGAA